MMRISRVRKHIWISATSLVVAALIVLAVVYILPGLHRPDLKPVELRGGTVYLKLAATPESRAQGLSGVTSMRQDEGILMDFGTDDKWGIWMKDMSIPIDILWVTKDKKVIYVVREAQPELSTAKIFTPKEPARYVIELNSGAASRYVVKVGDVIRF